MNEIPLFTLAVATACAVFGVGIGLFFWACSESAEAQHRKDEEGKE